VSGDAPPADGPAAAPSEGGGDLLVPDPARRERLARLSLLGFDALASSPRLRLVRAKPDRWIATLSLEADASGAPAETYYVKRHRRPAGLIERALARLLGRAPATEARAEWARARRLEASGLPAPPLVALGERIVATDAGPVVDALLVTAALPGYVQLEALVPARYGPRDDRARTRERRDLARALGRLARRLHSAGLRHRDLYLTHVLVREAALGALADSDLALIDLQRAGPLGLLAGRARVKDLAALAYSSPAPAISRTDRLRFLRAYLAVPEGERLPRAARRLARRVLAKAARIGRRHARVKARRALEGTVAAAQAVAASAGAIAADVAASAASEAAAPAPPVPAPHVRARIAGLRCEALAAHAGRLLALAVAGDAPLPEGYAAALVKRGAGRAVFRVTSPGGIVAYVKRFTALGPLRALGALAQGSPAAREHAIASALLGRGVPTARPIAWGEGARLATRPLGFVATEAVTLARSLRDVCDEERPRGRRAHALASALGRLLRGLHEAGARPRDLHAANILLREGAPGPEMVPVDVAGWRIGGPLGVEAGARSLGGLWFFFAARTTRAQRVRFLEAYLGSSGEADAEGRGARRARRAALDSLAAACAGAAERARARFLRERARKCLRESGALERVRIAGGIAGLARRGLKAEVDLGDLLAAARAAPAPRRPSSDSEGTEAAPPPPAPPGPGSPFACTVLKASRGTRVIRATDTRGRSWIVKIYRRRGGTGALLALLRGPRARRAWRAAFALEARGIPHARALACLEARGFGIDSALVLEDLPGEDLVRLAARLDPPARRRALVSLGRAIRALHAEGIRHGDLKAANVLGREGPGGAFAFALLDVDALRAGARPPSESERAKDLAQLASRFVAGERRLPLAAFLRFLRAYGASREERRRLVARVARLLAG
jgi:heptose I phosphotransferase